MGSRPNSSDVTAYEAECLAEVKGALCGPRAPAGRRIQAVELKGEHPDTKVAVKWVEDETKQEQYDEWFLWQPAHGLVGDPWRAPSFVANVVWANIEES